MYRLDFGVGKGGRGMGRDGSGSVIVVYENIFGTFIVQI